MTEWLNSSRFPLSLAFIVVCATPLIAAFRERWFCVVRSRYRAVAAVTIAALLVVELAIMQWEHFSAIAAAGAWKVIVVYASPVVTAISRIAYVLVLFAVAVQIRLAISQRQTHYALYAIVSLYGVNAVVSLSLIATASYFLIPLNHLLVAGLFWPIGSLCWLTWEMMFEMVLLIVLCLALYNYRTPEAALAHHAGRLSGAGHAEDNGQANPVDKNGVRPRYENLRANSSLS